MARRASREQLQAIWTRAHGFLAKGQPARARPLLEKLVKAVPDDPAVHYNLGACLVELGKAEAAYPNLKKAHALGFPDPALALLLGQVAQAMGRRDEAEAALRAYLAARPEDMDATRRLGAMLQAANRSDAAAEIYERALGIRPDDVDLRVRLGNAQREAGRFGAARATLEGTRATGPARARVLNATGVVHQNVGALARAAELYRAALEADPADRSAAKNLAFVTMNLPGLDPETRFATYRALVDRYNGQTAVRPAARDRDPDRRLRVGYVSSDFRIHVVGLNLIPLIENHDPDAVELSFFSDLAVEDEMTARFKRYASRWVPIAHLADAEAAQAIAEAGIDIAVYLAGWLDQNRAQIAAFRPAPVQVSYHDVATSGLDAMDYFLTDAILHPPDTPERTTETLFRLPVFYQYLAPGERAPVPPPVESSGHITFGSFNKPEKLNGEVIQLWARVLNAVPGSCLLLKYFDYYRAPEAQSRIAERFAAHGIGAERLVFRSANDIRRDHLALYGAVDIALDPFPFAGATTTFEALAAGVPVISLAGDSFVSRAGNSILTHAGLADLVAPDADAYVETARALAADRDRLAALRRDLPGQVAASPLCDGAAYARAVEAAYRDMWRRWCAAGD